MVTARIPERHVRVVSIVHRRSWASFEPDCLEGLPSDATMCSVIE